MPRTALYPEVFTTFSILLFVIVFCSIILVAVSAVLAVTAVGEHARSDPAAAKALYEHVFLPIFVGKPDAKPEGKAAVTPAAAAKKPDGPEWEC